MDCTSALPSLAGLGNRVEWDPRVLVRSRAWRHRAQGVDSLDRERRPLPRPTDRRPS